MTKSWRPEGWEMPLEIKPVGESGKKAFHMIDRFSYEAGADAILKALIKDSGTHFEKDEWTDDATFMTGEPGSVVFIPDMGDE